MLSLALGATLCYHASSWGQCSGSTGSPVVNTTFGSGANPGPTLSTAVPAASTTYTYFSASGTPPATIPDGSYCLVNQIPSHSSGGWHSGAPDHTGNTNGYMAFFNASQNPGEFYREKVDNLCPGTTYVFSTWVLNASNSSVVPGSAKPDLTFRITNASNVDLITPFVTGPINQNPTPIWVSYSTSITVPPGTTSINLIISNTVAGGSNLGNDFAIDDITFSPCGPLTSASFDPYASVINSSICTGTSVNIYGSVGSGFSFPAYQWQASNDGGVTWNDISGATGLSFILPGSISPGNYQFRMLSAEASNINSPNCRFQSNAIFLTVKDCKGDCSDSCYWKVTGNNIIGGNNIFGTVSSDDIIIQSSASDRGVITRDGLLGWNTMIPTAYLHVNCDMNNPSNGVVSDVRFEKLEYGSGNILVINRDGYVMDSKIDLNKYLSLRDKVESLNNELGMEKKRNDRLETELDEIYSLLRTFTENINENNNVSKLFQNIPNPFGKETDIPYFINNMKSSAYIVLYDLNGKEINRYNISKEGNGVIKVNANEFISGIYMYTLFIDGTKVATQKMVCSK